MESKTQFIFDETIKLELGQLKTKLMQIKCLGQVST